MATIEHNKPASGRVLAKFYVYSVALTAYSTKVSMRPVTKGEENKEWATSTPNGTIELEIRNDAAAERFSPGQEWLLTFEAAPPEPEPGTYSGPTTNA
jgi:hypothetical protein